MREAITEVVTENPDPVYPVDFLDPYLGEIACGPASLHMAYRCYGIEIPEEDLAEDLYGEEFGTPWHKIIEQILDTEFEIKFQTNATYEELLDTFKRHRAPIIIGWTSDRSGEAESHYSVIKLATTQGLVIADPEFGDFHYISKKDFLPVWRLTSIKHSYLELLPPNEED